MSGPISRLFDALHARWTERAYEAPLVYGFRQSFRTDLDPVAKVGGRVVMHAGFSGEDADAGELDATILQAYESGRAVATNWTIFTVYCHGYNSTAPDDEKAQDDAAWCLFEQFLGVLSNVKPGMGHYWRLVSQAWRRSPQERRYGELIRLVFSVSFSVREAPEYPLQTATPVPKMIVETPGGNVAIIEGDS